MSLRLRDRNLAEALRMGFKPQGARSAGGIEPKLLPPRRFIAVTVNFAMVSPAQRDREFVTDFAAERAVLQMVGVTRMTSADQAGLLGNKAHMLAIANMPRFRVRQHRLVDRRCRPGCLPFVSAGSVGFVCHFSIAAHPRRGGWQSSTAWHETPPRYAWRLSH